MKNIRTHNGLLVQSHTLCIVHCEPLRTAVNHPFPAIRASNSQRLRPKLHHDSPSSSIAFWQNFHVSIAHRTVQNYIHNHESLSIDLECSLFDSVALNPL